MKTKVELTDDELTLLDGKCSDDVQKMIDFMRSRHEIEKDGLSPEQSEMIAKIINFAKTNGRLRFQHTSIHFCPVCKTSSDYVRYKSGRRRGEKNYDKRLSLPAVDLSDSFVSIRHHVSLGCCKPCWEIISPKLLEKIKSVPCEIPDHLNKEKTKYKKYPMRKCSDCGWVGSERLMIPRRTIMGDGYYPAGCPQCRAENLFMGKTIIESADGFELHKLESNGI